MSAVEDRIVIETLAASEAELLDRIVDLTVTVESYRILAQQAIHALHEIQTRLRNLEERHQRLLQEYREFREQSIRDDQRRAAA